MLTIGDIRDQSRALVWRKQLLVRLADRQDIHLLAAPLIKLQDRVPLSAAETKRLATVHSHTTHKRLPTARVMSAVLTPHEEFDPERSQALHRYRIPGGVRHSHLHFSPILQIALLNTTDGCVEGRHIAALPSTAAELMDWLGASAGLVLPPIAALKEEPSQAAINAHEEKLHEREEEDDDVATAFAKRFLFSLEALADWLMEIRGRDPILFVLLLSREYILAVRRDRAIARDHTPKLPGFRWPPIIALMAVAELQRARAIMRDLRPNVTRTMTNDARTVAADGGSPRKLRRRAFHDRRARKLGKHIGHGSRVGRAYDDVHLQSAAIRRLMSIDFAKLEQLPPLQTWKALMGGNVKWDNAVMARGSSRPSRRAAHEAVVVMLDNQVIQRPHTGGRGSRHHNLTLDVFYGVDDDVLPHLAVYEAGTSIRPDTLRDECKIIAARMHQTQYPAAENQGYENRQKTAIKHYDTYLRPFPKSGSGPRFMPTNWLHPMRDQALLDALSTPVPPAALKRQFPRRRWMIRLAQWMLQLLMRPLYRYRPAQRLWPILCDVMVGVTFVSRDPLFRAMLHRKTAAALIRDRENVPASDNGRDPDEKSRNYPPHRKFVDGRTDAILSDLDID